MKEMMRIHKNRTEERGRMVQLKFILLFEPTIRYMFSVSPMNGTLFYDWHFHFLRDLRHRA